jgi:hypothetical protein
VIEINKRNKSPRPAISRSLPGNSQESETRGTALEQSNPVSNLLANTTE